MAASQPISTVAVGGFELVVGSPGGTRINRGPVVEEPEGLARALEDESPARSLGTVTGSVVETASEVTARIEEASKLFAALAEGSILAPDPARLDLMLEMLQRLVGEGRWEEALRLARAMNGLLALVKRWADLVRSLAVALRAAEQLGNSSALAWAQHELGTLHLAVEDHIGADRWLAQAQEIRRRLGDREGLAATEHNLETLCRCLREALRDSDRRSRRGRTRRSLALGIAAAVLLLLVGGVAGAMIAHRDDPPDTQARRAKLTVRLIGTGTVTSRPAGIRCTDDCDAEFVRGRRVSLTASAGSGSRFVGWGGDCRGTRPCRLILDDPRTVIARFEREPDSRTLRVEKSGAAAGDGRVRSRTSGIDCGTACSTSVKRGSRIQLMATAVDDATFAGWSGGGCSRGGSCNVTVAEDMTVRARFTVPPVAFALAVMQSGKGSGVVTSSPRASRASRTAASRSPRTPRWI
jgi:List-Bact-rpt repeat protein